jgi:hypothetical protein
VPVVGISLLYHQSEAYESLQIRYADVISIELKSGPGTTRVMAKLSAPAIVAEVPMKTRGELALAFDIKNEDIKRFLEALNSRGLVSSQLSLSKDVPDCLLGHSRCGRSAHASKVIVACPISYPECGRRTHSQL